MELKEILLQLTNIFARERPEDMNQGDASFDLVTNYTLKADSLARKGWFKSGTVGVNNVNRSLKRHSSRLLTLLKYDKHSRFFNFLTFHFNLVVVARFHTIFLCNSSPNLWNLSMKYYTKKSQYLWNKHITARKILCMIFIPLIHIRKLTHLFSNTTQLVNKNCLLKFSMK